MLRILVVDDSELWREQVRNALDAVERPEIAEILTATDGYDAIRLLQSDPGKVDAVILDLEMPQMDGITFLDELSAKQLDVPVIVYSAMTNEQQGIDAILKGAKAAIPKQKMTTEILADALQTLLAG